MIKLGQIRLPLLLVITEVETEVVSDNGAGLKMMDEELYLKELLPSNAGKFIAREGKIVQQSYMFCFILAIKNKSKLPSHVSNEKAHYSDDA